MACYGYRPWPIQFLSIVNVDYPGEKKTFQKNSDLPQGLGLLVQPPGLARR